MEQAFRRCGWDAKPGASRVCSPALLAAAEPASSASLTPLVCCTTQHDLHVRNGIAPADHAHAAPAAPAVQSGMDNVRNITGSPIAGIDPHELIDTRPLCHGALCLLAIFGGCPACRCGMHWLVPARQLRFLHARLAAFPTDAGVCGQAPPHLLPITQQPRLCCPPHLSAALNDAITSQGAGNAALTNLPRKINIGISSSRDDFAHCHINDVGLKVRSRPDLLLSCGWGAIDLCVCACKCATPAWDRGCLYQLHPHTICILCR